MLVTIKNITKYIISNFYLNFFFLHTENTMHKLKDHSIFPDICDRYYECDSSLVATIKFCNNGLLFSESHQDCVAAEDSECQVLTTVNNEATTVQGIVSSESSISSDSPTSTEPDIRVSNNSPISSITSEEITSSSVTMEISISDITTDVTTDGLTSMSVTPSSESPTDSTTAVSTQTSTDNSIDTTTPAQQECTSFSRLPDLTSCNKFYICVWRPFEGFIKISRNCPFRLVYDVRRRSCRFNTDCGNRPRSS